MGDWLMGDSLQRHRVFQSTGPGTQKTLGFSWNLVEKQSADTGPNVLL